MDFPEGGPDSSTGVPLFGFFSPLGPGTAAKSGNLRRIRGGWALIFRSRVRVRNSAQKTCPIQGEVRLEVRSQFRKISRTHFASRGPKCGLDPA